MFAPTLLHAWPLLLAGCGASSEPPPAASVRVVVDLPGAAPEEVRFGVTRPLEEAIRERSDVAHVFTTSTEGQGVLTVQFEPEVVEHHTKPHLLRVRDTVEPMRRMLPTEAELPLLLNVRIEQRTSFLLAPPDRVDAVVDAIERGPQVQDVRVSGESGGVEVQVDPRRLAAHGLSIDAVERAIASSSLNPEGGGVLIRTNQVPDGEALGRVVLREGLTLGDVATIRVRPAERRVTTGSGEPAVWIEVVGQPPLQKDRPAGLEPLDHRVDLVGKGVASALGRVPDGVRLLAQSPVEATAFFDDEAARDSAVASWTRRPDLLVHPAVDHHQHLFVVAPDGDPPAFLASSSLPISPLDPPPEPGLQFKIDREAAAAAGVSTADVAAQLRWAVAGREVAPGVQLSVSGGSPDPSLLQQLQLPTADGGFVSVGAIATMQLSSGTRPLHHWNGLRVVPYVVTADEPLEKADVTAVFEAAGDKTPFWLGPL